MSQRPMWPEVSHAFHALLPVVPPISEAIMDDPRVQRAMPVLPLGFRFRILELLPVVRKEKGQPVMSNQGIEQDE